MIADLRQPAFDDEKPVRRQAVRVGCEDISVLT
jgi:hypothetical protein